MTSNPMEVAAKTNLLKSTLEKSTFEDDAKAGSVRGAVPLTTSTAIPTKDGTLYVSKPFRSTYSKKLKAAVTFVPRTSHFDIGNEKSGSNEFRGFFTLFWISIFLFTIRTYIRSYETSGYALNLGFATMFSRDALTLAISDAVLVLSTGLCVPFAIALKRGWINYDYIGLIIHHTFQTLVLAIAVTWTFNRQWPWVQSGFLTLHSITMIMKMHSYCNVNGSLQRVSQERDKLLTRLRDATSRVGGWDAAVFAAKSHRLELDGASLTDDTSTPPIGTPSMPEDAGAQRSYIDAGEANALRRRLNAVDTNAHRKGVEAAISRAFDRSPSPSSADETEDIDVEKRAGKRRPDAAYALVDHPDQQIVDMAKDYVELDGELVSTGPERMRWPENVTLKNFAVYMLIPSLCYELEYPRTERIRPLYVFEKTTATFGTFALLYTVTETFILPMTPGPNSDQSFARSLLDLALPFMIAYLLLFYIIFECICNAFAELSYFADRQFYEDWWNSTSWDEFSRKWNKPVHTFLLRHVYASTITSYRLSRFWAMFITFLLSAAVHELVMAIVTQKIRMYLFMLQLIQIPLIMVGRLPAIKRNKLMGNVVFWLGLYAGFPLLCVAYVAY